MSDVEVELAVAGWGHTIRTSGKIATERGSVSPWTVGRTWLWCADGRLGERTGSHRQCAAIWADMHV